MRSETATRATALDVPNYTASWTLCIQLVGKRIHFGPSQSTVHRGYARYNREYVPICGKLQLSVTLRFSIGKSTAAADVQFPQHSATKRQTSYMPH
jgi:hypothetical protein